MQRRKHKLMIQGIFIMQGMLMSIGNPNAELNLILFPDKLILLLNLQSRDRLLRALRAMNAGDAADQVIRQVDKMIKNSERASRDARLGKVDKSFAASKSYNFLIPRI